MFKLSKQTIEMMWRDCDVPINDYEEIDDDWCGWERFTPREDIWRWFDEQYALYGGVHALMFPSEHEQNHRGPEDLMKSRKNAYRRHNVSGMPSAHVYD